MPRERRLANCLGEENLAHALSNLEADGFAIEFVFFTGQVPIPRPADIINIGPEDGMEIIAKYLVIAVKDDA